MGKTSFALYLAKQAISAGYGVAFFSMEMTANELINREVGQRASVDTLKVLNANLERDEYERVARALEVMRNEPLYIDERADSNPDYVFSQALALKARLSRSKHPLGLIVLDYLQLIDAQKSGRNEHLAAAIGRLTRACKRMAKELGVPFVLLSQLNREVERRQDKRPTQADLRESGAIEQDADHIIFLYRHSKYAATDYPEVIEVEASKVRGGRPTTAYARFTDHTASFSEIPYEMKRKYKIERINDSKRRGSGDGPDL
jgi:replicative DNA helicase